MERIYSARRVPEPQHSLAWLGLPRSAASTARVALEKFLQGSISPSVKRVGWTPCSPKGLPALRWDREGWMGGGFQRGGLFSSDLTSCLFGWN